MKRPVPVVVAQVIIVILFLNTISMGIKPPIPGSVTSYALRVMSFIAAAFLAFAFVAIVRRSSNAHLMAASAVFLFTLLSVFSIHSRALWSAFLRGESSTHLPPPYFNYNSPVEIASAAAVELCSKLVLIGVTAYLTLSSRVKAFFRMSRDGAALPAGAADSRLRFATELAADPPPVRRPKVMTTTSRWALLLVALFVVAVAVWMLARDRAMRVVAQTTVHGGIAVPGWRIVRETEQMTEWQDVDGDALSLTSQSAVRFSELADENEVRRRCRELAESTSAGLVEAAVVTGANGPAVMLVYKRLDMPAFVFTGILVVAPSSRTSTVWTVVARERGTTGVREAVVTAQLVEEGKLTLESYEAKWAQDPYDPTYHGVDRRTLRYLSDSENYDSQFPRHPLSKVRRELRRVLAVKLQPEPPH